MNLFPGVPDTAHLPSSATAIHPSELCRRSEIIDSTRAGGGFLLHPIDVIMLVNPDTPHARLDALGAYFGDLGARRLDAAAARVLGGLT